MGRKLRKRRRKGRRKRNPKRKRKKKLRKRRKKKRKRLQRRKKRKRKKLLKRNQPKKVKLHSYKCMIHPQVHQLLSAMDEMMGLALKPKMLFFILLEDQAEWQDQVIQMIFQKLSIEMNIQLFFSKLQTQ